MTTNDDAYRQYQSRMQDILVDGDSQAAVDAVTETIGHLGPRAELFSDRATFRMAIGDVAGALEDWTRVIDLQPANEAILAYAFSHRAFARSLLGEHAGAIDDYVQGIRLVPSYGHVFYVLPQTTASPESPVRVSGYAAASANRAAANLRLRQDDDAKEDYAQAAKLFLQVGDQDGYRRVMRELEQLTHQED